MSKKLFIVLVSLILSQIAFAQKTLDEKVKNAIKGFDGKVWIYAKNLDTGKDFSLRGDEQVRTASTIKLPIMAETFRQVESGKLKWTDEIVLTKDNKKGGSGILFEFSDGTKIDLKTALHLMIVVSDNTATNLVLDKVTADSVNDFLDSLGIKTTRSLRKVLGGGESKILKTDEKMKAFGLGVSTPKDMVKILELIETGKLVSKEASAEMLEILKRQQFKDGIGRGLPDSIISASKSGALDKLRSDVGIIYTNRGRIAIAITTDDMPNVFYNEENPGLKMIWNLSQILQDGLGK